MIDSGLEMVYHSGKEEAMFIFFEHQGLRVKKETMFGRKSEEEQVIWAKDYAKYLKPYLSHGLEGVIIDWTRFFSDLEKYSTVKQAHHCEAKFYELLLDIGIMSQSAEGSWEVSDTCFYIGPRFLIGPIYFTQERDVRQWVYHRLRNTNYYWVIRRIDKEYAKEHVCSEYNYI